MSIHATNSSIRRAIDWAAPMARPAALPLALILTPVSAQAHIGHLGDIAGHGHWLGAAAIGAAIAIALGQGLKAKAKGQPDTSEPEADDIPEEDLQEA